MQIWYAKIAHDAVKLLRRGHQLHSGYSLRNSGGPLWDPYLSVANLGGPSSTWRWELKQPSLRIPIKWHLDLPASDCMQIQMPWLPTFEDRANDVRRPDFDQVADDRLDRLTDCACPNMVLTLIAHLDLDGQSNPSSLVKIWSAETG